MTSCLFRAASTRNQHECCGARIFRAPQHLLSVLSLIRTLWGIEMRVRLNPAVRIIPPSQVTGERWQVEDLLERRRFKLTRRAAAALVASCIAREPDDLAAALAGGEDEPGWAGIVANLTKHGLIVDETALTEDPRLAWFVRLRREWSSRGWHEAAEYHLLSFDYPCIDYSEARAFLYDQDLMRSYQAREPDDDRFKLDYSDASGIPLPDPSAAIPSGTAHDVWVTRAAREAVDSAKVANIISLAFGATGFLTTRTDAAQLLRRTSPSGGARHPSEGYAVILDVPGAEPGWYHITMQPFSLRRLDGRPTDSEELRRLFPETFERFPLKVACLIVVTSRFERNMYRYREPRTFRTVHMDAGHIAGTIRMAARAMGLTAGINLCDHATEIESAIGIDGMAEGYMLTVALSAGINHSAGALEDGEVNGTR
jgi:SagB-type dehydrogenase family enzyme